VAPQRVPSADEVVAVRAAAEGEASQ
jgi:hypothetical protein